MGIKIEETIRLPENESNIIITMRSARTGKVLSRRFYHNTSCIVAKEMVAARLAGGAGTCDITYCAVGTGAIPGNPSASETLTTELYRKLLTSISAAGTVISLSVFFGAAEANGTLTEMGWFGQGASATPDSGVMINHAALTETKTTSKTMTIEGTLSIG